MRILLSLTFILLAIVSIAQRGLPDVAEEALKKIKEFEVFEDSKSKDGPYKHYKELKASLDGQVMLKLSMSEQEPIACAYTFLAVLESGEKSAKKSIEMQKANRGVLKYKTDDGIQEKEIYLWMIEKYQEYGELGKVPMDDSIVKQLNTWHESRTNQILREEKFNGTSK